MQVDRRYWRALCTGSEASRPIMQGMLVLELANVLAGPSVGQFFSELGARVVKVESPVTGGDVTRTWKLGNEPADEDVTAYFSSCNLNKQSLAVDLTSTRGIHIVHELAKRADCVVASFKPGDAEKLQVDWDTLQALNPKLIYGQITGYGLDDPRMGYDAVIQAESGFQYMNGTPESGPCKMPVALIDVLSAHQLKEAMLIELWRRDRTGKGAFVNVSLMAAAITSLANQAGAYLREGVIPERLSSDHPTITPYGTIFSSRNSSEQFTIGAGSNKQFQKLCSVIGREDLYESDGRFVTNQLRCQHREALKEILAAEFSDWDRSELLQALERESVPAGAVNNIRDSFKQPVAQELVVYDEGDRSKRPIGLRQIAFKGSPEGVGSRQAFTNPPKFGQNSTQVLRELVSLTDKEIQDLRDQNIIK